MAKSNRYNGYSKETLEILARMKEEEKENSISSRIKNYRKAKKEERELCEQAEGLLTCEIARSSVAMAQADPGSVEYARASESISKMGETVERINNKRNVDKKIIAPIAGAIAVTGLCYGAERLGHTSLTGGLKTIGSGAQKAITNTLGKFRKD